MPTSWSQQIVNQNLRAFDVVLENNIPTFFVQFESTIIKCTNENDTQVISSFDINNSYYQYYEVFALNNDLIINGLVGSSGMEPTLCAIKKGTNVALANKESLVMAGPLIKKAMNKSGAKIFPVDSEHSAIWQCLSGEVLSDVKRLILTGSGGTFRTR